MSCHNSPAQTKLNCDLCENAQLWLLTDVSAGYKNVVAAQLAAAHENESHPTSCMALTWTVEINAPYLVMLAIVCKLPDHMVWDSL